MKRTFEWHEGLGALDVVHRHSSSPARDWCLLLLAVLFVAELLRAAPVPPPTAAAPAPQTGAVAAAASAPAP